MNPKTRLRRHATVIRDGFEVPLIGIPPDAVLEECDLCGETIGISQATFTGSQVLCAKCVSAPAPAPTPVGTAKGQ